MKGFALVFLLIAACRSAESQLRVGDLLFHASPENPLVNAIEGASGSPYSHCGILKVSGGQWVVLEAVGPVKQTPLGEWVARGREGRYAVY